MCRLSLLVFVDSRLRDAFLKASDGIGSELTVCSVQWGLHSGGLREQ